jgi:hypothetical protein
MNIMKNNASASAWDPFWTSEYTPRRIGALTIKAIRNLFCAASIFVIGIDRPFTALAEDQEQEASAELAAQKLDRLCLWQPPPSMPRF